MSQYNQKKNIFSKVGSNPQIDWAIIMLVSAIVTAIFVAWSVIVYNNTKEIDSITNSADVVSDGLDHEKLSRVIGIFDEKARQREELKRGYPGAPDPSI